MADRSKDGLKKCSKCKIWKALSEFHARNDRKSGVRAACKDCTRQYFFIHGRRMTLKKYGLTEPEYEEMLSSQDSVCVICGRPELRTNKGTPISLSIDHCHLCNERRSLLCGDCNRAIGWMGEDPERLINAAIYVASHTHRET